MGNIIPEIQILGLAGGLSSKKEKHSIFVRKTQFWQPAENTKEPCHCGRVLTSQASDGFRNQGQNFSSEDPGTTSARKIKWLLLKLGRSRWKPRNFSNTVIKFKKLLSGDFLGSVRLCVSTAGGTGSVPGQHGQKKKKFFFKPLYKKIGDFPQS